MCPTFSCPLAYIHPSKKMTCFQAGNGLGSGLQLPMNTIKSQFNKCVKVREKQYKFLKNCLPQYKTIAGRLDFIINKYKDEILSELRETKGSVV